MNELCLFAGAGGGSLASKHLLGHTTVCYVEIADYCQQVLQARIRDGLLDDAPIWDDVRTFDGRPWRGCVDLITAGFPCQPFSCAGQQRGKDDERNMWPETIRIIREVGPRFCLLENVSNLLAYEYYGTILGELAESGFDIRWGVLSAAGVGANHLRNRLWIYADADRDRGLWRKAMGRNWRELCKTYVGPMRHVAGGYAPTKEPAIPRVAVGLAAPVEQYRALGNAQVPLVVATAWRLLTK